MYFSKIMQTFWNLLFTRKKSEWQHLFFLFVFCLIIFSLWLIVRQFYYITINLTVKLNDKETFDQVSLHLLDAVHQIMNQKHVYFLKRPISDGLLMLISLVCLLFGISLVKFLKIIAPKSGQIPQKYHSMSNFREASSWVPLIFTENNLPTVFFNQI